MTRLTYAERRARMRPKPFALEPLAVLAGIRFGQCASDEDTLTGTLAERLGIGARAVKRLRQQGMSAATADRYAVVLDLHPAVVWPEVWDVGREPEPGPPPAPSWMGLR